MERSLHNARIYSGSANKDTFLVPTPLPESRSREFFFTMSTSSLMAEKTLHNVAYTFNDTKLDVEF